MNFAEKSAVSGMQDPQYSPSDDELIEAAADSIMERFKPAFEELSK